MFNTFIWRERKLKIPVSVFVPLRSDLEFSATFSCPLVTRGHHSKQLYTFDLAEFYAKCPFLTPSHVYSYITQNLSVWLSPNSSYMIRS